MQDTAASTSDKAPDAPITTMTYSVLPERLPRIPPDEMTDEQRKVVADLTASRGSLRGPFSASMRCPELMDRMQKLGECVRFRSGLPLRLSRLTSLMVARCWTNQYEWHTGVPHAREAGLDAAIIDAIAEGRRPLKMAQDEEVVYDFLTELFTNRSVSDPTYARAVAEFGEPGVVELVAIAGYYTTNAMIMNVSRTPVPGGKPPSLAPLPGQIRPEV